MMAVMVRGWSRPCRRLFFHFVVLCLHPQSVFVEEPNSADVVCRGGGTGCTGCQICRFDDVFHYLVLEDYHVCIYIYIGLEAESIKIFAINEF